MKDEAGGGAVPFHEMRQESRKRMVKAFMIWRAGSSVNWDCSPADIAAEIGISVKTVWDIMRERKWSCNEDVRNEASLRIERADIHLAMTSHNENYRGRA